MDAQATGEAFSPQKRRSSTSKDENSVLFSIFFWHFLPSWIGIRISNLYADPDPDPAAQINADPCGSGSETLFERVQVFSHDKNYFYFRLQSII
jgi:hypothetical protein